MRVFALTLLLGLALPTTALAIPRGTDGRALQEAATMLVELRVEEALRTFDRLALAYPDDPDVRFERGLGRFYTGDYQGAVQDLDAAGDRGTLRSAQDRAGLGALIRSTLEATRAFETARSDDGRYLVRYAPGPDRVLVPYAIEAMREADRTLSEAFGIRVPGPLRLEIFPTAASLAQVSTLTVEEISTTGTIALCKWDRIMVTTPRALVRGYPWMDTIGHELVHLFLSRASRDRAPVWVQEGYAKFLERTWRGEPPGAHLDPAEEGLLQNAAAEGRLLSFDQLHPSIARLPSQEDAALAFAQVATFIEGYHAAHGGEGLRRVVERMAGGTDAREALAEVAGQPWGTLETAWRDRIADRPGPPSDPPRLLGMRFRGSEEEPDEAQELENEEARRFLRLGDLLWDRRRARAAAVEYGRARELAPDDPIVASRLAMAAIAGDTPQAAVDALAPFRERYPDHAPTWALSGTAYRMLGRVEDARRALAEALRLNPFDPQPHCDLAEVAPTEPERRREASACRSLGGGRR